MANQPDPIDTTPMLAAFAGAANPASVRTTAIKLAQFQRIMRNHRALPLLFPLISALSIATLDAQMPLLAVGIWAAAVVAIWAEIAWFSARYFAGKLAADPDKLSMALSLRYVLANLIWIGILPLFWSNTDQAQDFFLLLLFVAHLAVATAITSYDWRVYLACTVPITAAIALITLPASDGVHWSVGVLVVMIYAFMLSVARQGIAQTAISIGLKLDHADLIRDLAAAKTSSDRALQDAEAANTRLARSEQRFRALVDNAFDGVIIAAADGRIKFATDAMARMFDTTPIDLCGRTLTSLSTDDSRQQTEELLSRLLSKPGERGRYAGWAQTLTGRKIWVEASCRNMMSDTGVNGIVMNVRDATARKSVDGELKMHLHVLEALAAGVPMSEVLNKQALAIEELQPDARASILLVRDDQTLRVGAAPSLPSAYGQYFEGTPATTLTAPCGKAISTRAAVIITDAATAPEFEGRQAFREEVNIGSVWSYPILSRHGQILGSIAMIFTTPRKPSDNERNFLSGAAKLTAVALDRRNAQQRLAEALRTAEIANHAKTEFLANMSHELRTPLNAIIGFSEMMREETFGPVGVPEYADYIKDIHSSGRHLLELINDILDISKIEAGQFAIHETEVSLAAAALWCKELMLHRARENGVSIQLDDLDALPLVYADERSIRQILLNLMSNATKFTPRGGTVCVSGTYARNGDLFVCVSDTGIGIKPELIERVMEPFGQAEGPITRNFGGTGLGLPITKSLIELHGGSLSLESTPGEGTRVTVRLPAWRVQHGSSAAHQDAHIDAVLAQSHS